MPSPFLEIFYLLFQPTFGAISFILSPFLKLSHAFGAIFLVKRTYQSDGHIIYENMMTRIITESAFDVTFD